MSIWISLDWDYVNGNMYPDSPEGVTPHCSREKCWAKEDTSSSHMIMRAFGEPQPGWEKRLAGIQEIARDAKINRVVFRDSHAHICRFLKKRDICYHIDAHPDNGMCSSDSGYGVEDMEATSHLMCGTWVCFARQKGVSVIKTHPGELAARGYSFSRDSANLFICLSRPYTLPEFDKYLFDILINFKVPIDFMPWG